MQNDTEIIVQKILTSVEKIPENQDKASLKKPNLVKEKPPVNGDLI